MPRSYVAITDKDAALRKALKDIIPDVQLQSCQYHILANVKSKINTRFIDAGVLGSENNAAAAAHRANEYALADEIVQLDLGLQARHQVQQEAEEGIIIVPPSASQAADNNNKDNPRACSRPSNS